MRSVLSLAFLGLVSLASAVPAQQRHGHAVLSELVRFNASTAYLADQSVLEPGLNKLEKCRGFKYAYHAVQVEDGKTGQLIIGWDQNIHHGELREECVSAKKVVEHVTAPGGTIDIQHILFSVDLTSVLTAPFTEFATILLNEGASDEALVDGIKTILIPALDAAPVTHPPSAWGKSQEKDRIYMTIVGWDSIEAHTATLAAPPFSDKVIPYLLQFATATTVHYRLHKH